MAHHVIEFDENASRVRERGCMSGLPNVTALRLSATTAKEPERATTSTSTTISWHGNRARTCFMWCR
jgi:hypothetical protein